VFALEKNTVEGVTNQGQRRGVNQVVQVEPKNFIYPYLSKRKVAGYGEQVNEQVTNSITGNLQNLYAKVDRLSNPQLPAYQYYMNACQKTLGFVVTCVSSPNGKKACYVIDSFTSITVDNMGEGVANILGLLVDLSVAENRLFVIEEAENDIHPKALKGLLELIIEKSKNNQFIITTHSNIVTRYLGSEEGTKIFQVGIEYDKRKIPTSRVEKIPNTPEARRGVLEDLGYELNDVDLWEGWLFLEEASAEKIIREYLIRWFVPLLQGKLRTFSARSVDQVEIKFDDFNKLFCYLNLQPAYKNRVWVIVDGGETEKGIIEKIKSTYVPNGWNESNFRQFREHDFEKYYPDNFKNEVEAVLAITNKKKRQQKKMALFTQVESWIKENDEKARGAFEKSAAEVIEKLREIETEMTSSEMESEDS